MKQGDTVPVYIAGQVVAQASVKELAEGTATLVVPATLVVMATRTELTVDTPEPSATETIITGVDRTSAETANIESGPVVDSTQSDTQVTTADATAVESSAAGAEQSVTNTETGAVTPVEKPVAVETSSNSEGSDA